MDPIKNKIQNSSRETRQDLLGKILSYSCILLIVLVVLSIFFFVASKGIATFTVDHGNFWTFLTGKTWNPIVNNAKGQPEIGALPMIVGSFGVTILAALFATPFAIGTALYMTELASKRGERLLQSVVELLVGIPSVVYGFIGLSVIVPFVRNHFGGSGYGILSGSFVLFVMILPTITSMTVDSLRSVPRFYKEASLALGATKWQTIYKVILRSATSGILTAIIFGMARAFGEALAVQMVIGNAAVMPKNLLSSASTLTSILTMGIGNTVMGTVGNNALWSLALVLLLMSLLFNILVRLIGRKGRM
ncbi:MAG: phosphate ABC transporter permease subunit PstC [Liquorilactobacillus ghanensis]|jgi:phosphate transport system permease protein|uniref:Phosphate transport system permease protein n=1 Tax=Liquorilactobacillus ghanensis DSM 18630 TaxID=1423750 RepID=A0A0R1VFR7_9LACO|nr:phosphate ABC transporter permease subunit PstC [Liquorilactobacillus ghanensis]KRM04382.1 phosphate ABC transporter permease [Liquorilactobacillus ghanensis DSM 18630]